MPYLPIEPWQHAFSELWQSATVFKVGAIDAEHSEQKAKFFFEKGYKAGRKRTVDEDEPSDFMKFAGLLLMGAGLWHVGSGVALWAFDLACRLYAIVHV